MWIPFQPKMHCLNYYVLFEDGWHADSTRKCTIFYKETQKIHLFFLRVSYGSKTRVNHVTKVRTKKNRNDGFTTSLPFAWNAKLKHRLRLESTGWCLTWNNKTPFKVRLSVLTSFYIMAVKDNKSAEIKLLPLTNSKFQPDICRWLRQIRSLIRCYSTEGFLRAPWFPQFIKIDSVMAHCIVSRLLG